MANKCHINLEFFKISKVQKCHTYCIHTVCFKRNIHFCNNWSLRIIYPTFTFIENNHTIGLGYAYIHTVLILLISNFYSLLNCIFLCAYFIIPVKKNAWNPFHFSYESEITFSDYCFPSHFNSNH